MNPAQGDPEPLTVSWLKAGAGGWEFAGWTERTMPNLHVMRSHEEASRTAAQLVADLSARCLASRGSFSIALSGGATPRLLYDILASPPYLATIGWDGWRVFWGDERCVPPDHEDSNYRMAKESLLDLVPVPAANVHRMQGESVPHVAAQDYEELLKGVFRSPEPSFDLILLGIGDDGHTASLFPGTLALAERSRLVLHNWVPDQQDYRVTFTLPLINAARMIAFLVTDESKAEVLRRVLEAAPGEPVLPATLVRPSTSAVHWFLTQDAARLLGAQS